MLRKFIYFYIVFSLLAIGEGLTLDENFINEKTKYVNEPQENLTKEKIDSTGYIEIEQDKYDNQHPDLGAVIPDLKVENENELKTESLQEEKISEDKTVVENEDSNNEQFYTDEEKIEESSEKELENVLLNNNVDSFEKTEENNDFYENTLNDLLEGNQKRFTNPSVSEIVYKSEEVDNKKFQERFDEIMEENYRELGDGTIYVPNITSVKKYINKDYIKKLEKDIPIDSKGEFKDILDEMTSFYLKADGYMFWFNKDILFSKGDIYFRDINNITSTKDLNIINLSGKSAKKLSRMFISDKYECFTNITENNLDDKKTYTILLNFIKKDKMGEYIKYEDDFLLTELIADYFENIY